VTRRRGSRVERICHIARQMADGALRRRTRRIIHRDLASPTTFYRPRIGSRSLTHASRSSTSVPQGRRDRRATPQATAAGAARNATCRVRCCRRSITAPSPRARRHAVLTSGSGLPFNADNNFMGIPLTQHMYKAPVPILARFVPSPDCPFAPRSRRHPSNASRRFAGGALPADEEFGAPTL
jgi:hypothetical protein